MIALQAPINSGLGKATDTFAAAVISFGVGLIVLVAIATVAGQIGAISDATNVRWYYLIGGVLGAAYVTTVLLTVRTLGAGGVTAATVAGQLTASVIIDRLGIAGPGRDADHARSRDRRPPAVRRDRAGDSQLSGGLPPTRLTPTAYRLAQVLRSRSWTSAALSAARS